MKRKNTNAPGILPALRRTAAYLKKSLPLIIVALVLAMLGTEGENTDYGAHLFGLLSGFIVGGAASWLSRKTDSLSSRRINILLGFAAAGIGLLCWKLAL